MIEEMKFLTISGPKNDIDRMVEDYLSKYEIQLENALSELKTVKELTPFVEVNPYKSLHEKAEKYLSLIGGGKGKYISKEEAVALVKQLDASVGETEKKIESLEAERKKEEALYQEFAPYKELDIELKKLKKFTFIRYKFGRFREDDYQSFEKYVADDVESIFYSCYRGGGYVYGIFFVPASSFDKTETIYASLHYEGMELPEGFDDSPKQICQDLAASMDAKVKEIAACRKEIGAKLESQADEIRGAAVRLYHASEAFSVRKMAACTPSEEGQSHYILCGWIPKQQAKAFQEDVASDPDIYCIIEEDHGQVFNKPPTKLKNPKIFKPFEMFIRMYGLPAYDEFDPTIFVAVTYTLLFGAMFGDAGQGICLVIGGAILYRYKKLALAAIVSMAGIFSTIFGFLYGSFFGFENVLPALWLKPMEASVTLPLVGSLNTVLVVSVAFGMFLILFSMCINLYNGIRQKDKEKIFLSSNGIPGFVFYGAAVAVIFLYMTGRPLPATVILVVAFGLPLLLLLFKEPLEAWLEKKKMATGMGMYLIQALFELLEIVLSYLTNTISFVRIGAFALSHAGMMQVVMMLAGAENGGSPNWIVVVLGNVFVAAMEGLIVGIHVLRLEYYEMFSRFFGGNGREFKPFGIKERK